jgi:hypothetical protein
MAYEWLARPPQARRVVILFESEFQEWRVSDHLSNHRDQSISTNR